MNKRQREANVVPKNLLPILEKKDSKIFVLDTSVLIHEPQAIEKFQDNLVIIPIWVVEELDKLKRSTNGRGESAKLVSRILDAYSSSGGSFRQGIKTKDNGFLLVDSGGSIFSSLPFGFESTVDNRIIAVALDWQKKAPTKKVIVVSKDTNLRIKANALGIMSEDYDSDKRIHSLNELYSGSIKLPITDEKIELLYRQKFISIADLDEEPGQVLMPNQCCYLEGQKKYGLAIYGREKYDGQSVLLAVKKAERLIRERLSEKKICPKNDDQALAYHLLCDPKILLVTLIGEAGTGKTLIALLAAYEMLDKLYKKIIVYRPNIETGQYPLGYLPGEIEEKFAPYTKPICDILRLIISSNKTKKDRGEGDSIEDLKNSDKINIEPINFIRGSTIYDSIVIVDEAQNIRPEDARTILTRAGSGTKIIFTGDITQIDNHYVDSFSNGLTAVVEAFKGEELFGHMTLTKSERSLLAQKGARLM